TARAQLERTFDGDAARMLIVQSLAALERALATPDAGVAVLTVDAAAAQYIARLQLASGADVLGTYATAAQALLLAGEFTAATRVLGAWPAGRAAFARIGADAGSCRAGIERA